MFLLDLIMCDAFMGLEICVYVGANMHEYMHVCSHTGMHFSLVCLYARCIVVFLCVFDIYSGPQWSRCLKSQPPAPQYNTDPRSLPLIHTFTHTAPAP